MQLVTIGKLFLKGKLLNSLLGTTKAKINIDMQLVHLLE